MQAVQYLAMTPSLHHMARISACLARRKVPSEISSVPSHRIASHSIASAYCLDEADVRIGIYHDGETNKSQS
jgi:hypothetical protein